MSEPLKGGFASFTSPFGSNQPSTTGTAPTTNLFGGGSNANTTGSGAAPSTNAFGGFGTKPAGSVFGSSSTTAPSGGLFGNLGGTSASTTTAPSTQPAAPTANIFGSSTLFGAKPAEQSAGGTAGTTGTTGTTATGTSTLGGAFGSTLPKPTGSLFGSTTPATGSTQPAQSSAPSSFFANPPARPAEGGATTTSSPAPATSAFSLGANLFKKPDTPVGSTAAPSTTTAPPLFGGFGKKPEDAATGSMPAATTGMFGSTPGTTTSTTTSTAPATGTSPFGLFGPKKPDAPAENKDATADAQKKDATPAPAQSAFSLGGAAPKKDEGAPATAGSSTSPNIAVPPPSMLRGKTIEEIVNKWSTDLEAHVKEFNRLAGEINVWDRALIDNGNTIAALFQHVVMAEREQNDTEQSLKHVEEQQKELSATLEVYEKSLGEILDSQSGHRSVDVGPADAERDKHYTLASELHSNLDDLSRNLMQMIDSVNALTDSSQDSPDKSSKKSDAPLDQIAQILSSHLEGLQWIDGAVKEVDSKVTDVEKRLREASAGSGTAGVNGSSPTGFGSSTRSRGYGLMSR